MFMSEAPSPGGLAAFESAFDTSVPNVARIYDVLLGGKDNYEADRAAARRLMAAVPGAARAAVENRAFLGRAVDYLAHEAGIRQFIDIGAGLPTGGHVHEIARAADPAARVAYVDVDPVVVAHAAALLADTPGTPAGIRGVGAVHADVRYPRHLLALPAVRELIDFGQPAAVLLVAVLHFVEDAESPWAVVRCLTGYLAPGSYVVVSHVTGDEISPAAAQQARELYDGASRPAVARSREEIGQFFDGLDLLPPGVVDVASWRPGRPSLRPDPALFYVGVGRTTGRQS
jgi:S-adenosyl methyltransferase